MLPFSKTSSLHAWCRINGFSTGNPFFKRRNQSHPWFQYRKPSLQEEESEPSMVSIQETLSSGGGISHQWFQYRKPFLQEKESETSMVSIQETLFQEKESESIQVTLSSREGIRIINCFRPIYVIHIGKPIH